MQIKKSPSSSGVILQFRANRQLVQANKKALQEGLVASSNKDLVEAASKIQVTKKEPVKPGHVPFQERIPTSPPPEEAAKQFSTCYLEKLQSEPGSDSVSCFRSTGSVPIPTRRQSTIVNPVTPKPPPVRKISMPEPLWSFKEAKNNILEPLYEEFLEALPANDCNAVRTAIKPLLVSYDAKDREEKATVVDHPQVIEAPKPKPKPVFVCAKHSKCHCHLFSKEVDDFYSVTN